MHATPCYRLSFCFARQGTLAVNITPHPATHSGGELLFPQRFGFSGTPSDLLPRELGRCRYEKGSDGKVLATLTSPRVVTSEVVKRDWSVRFLLDKIANNDPPFHALIDTGALITGFTNQEVAQYLLANGLKMKGVVFLDSSDRKVVLVRRTMQVVYLSQCGIEKRHLFTFFDQVKLLPA